MQSKAYIHDLMQRQREQRTSLGSTQPDVSLIVKRSQRLIYNGLTSSKNDCTQHLKRIQGQTLIFILQSSNNLYPELVRRPDHLLQPKQLLFTASVEFHSFRM